MSEPRSENGRRARYGPSQAGSETVKRGFQCIGCGAYNAKGQGMCFQCKEHAGWEPLASRSAVSRGQAPRPLPITQVGTDGGEVRIRVGVSELDRVLGGGLVTGSLTLLGGDPGVGKSTLVLMVLARFAQRGLKVLYVTGEESARQVRLRAERLGIHEDTLFLLPENRLEAAIAAAEELDPTVLVIDSVQTLASEKADSVPGSVSQVRAVASAAMGLAKGKDIATFLVGHVTKTGGIAGPKVLEHLVDTVLYFEGDGRSTLRVLRATKNRFGATGELGFFEMVSSGLQEVPDASARLLKERVLGAPGTAVVAALEGSRPLLAEVQALVGRPSAGTPGRTALGIDRGRLGMLMAVLGKAGLPLDDRDVFVSAAGGLKITEPAADLGIAAALASSLLDRPLDPHTAVFGEVGLVGEIRAVGHPGPRLLEARRHGFRRVVAPATAVREAPEGLEVVGVRTLRDAIEALSGPKRPVAGAARDGYGTASAV
ncbi:MAG: DNA repair protein RadA [Proteobacteria bacterium]|nr:DNA repair protein RadA [Pseudomonadota bacterium]MCP4920334.1 DNA repair protein RadA [Pseudomonadota bacterium]